MTTADYLTKTGQWMLAIHRVTATSAEIWVGTLFPTLKMPDFARVELESADGSKRIHSIVRADWQRPFRNLNQRFYSMCHLDGLQPGCRYKVSFWRRIEAIAEVREESWQLLRCGAAARSIHCRQNCLRQAPSPLPSGLVAVFTTNGTGGK